MGKVSLKMQYLGDAYIGQDLCYYRIDISQNAVSVMRSDGHHERVMRFFDDPQEVEAIKAKLRRFITKCSSNGRCYVRYTTPHLYRIISYYPSRSWGAGTGRIRWMAPESF